MSFKFCCHPWDRVQLDDLARSTSWGEPCHHELFTKTGGISTENFRKINQQAVQHLLLARVLYLNLLPLKLPNRT